MRTGQHGPRAWGLALTLAVHALLWLVFLIGADKPRAPQPNPGGVMTVALVAPPPANAADAGPLQADSPVAPAPPLPEVAAEAVREELHYYFPEELERQLIVLRDRSGEAEIDLPGDVVMNLFVDVQGRVVAITFDGEPPSAALQAQLRDAFMSMEFMPGVRQGQAVPARIKIGIAPLHTPGAPASAPSY
jgi:hypothetical protein